MKPLSSSQKALSDAFASAEENALSFIIFKIGGEIYGTPLLTTREVIRHREIKPTPYMVPHFKGVINLRGQIVSVIDLRIKFQLPCDESQSLILIVESEHGLLGAVVDDLVSVETIQQTQIDQTASIETKVPVEFFLGIAKLEDRLVNMVDISGCLSSEDLRVLASSAS